MTKPTEQCPADVVERAEAFVREMRLLGMPNINTLERYRELTIELMGCVPGLITEVRRQRAFCEALKVGHSNSAVLLREAGNQYQALISERGGS